MDASQWNAIIVDDEPDNIGVIQLVFDFNDAKLRVAESGKECMRLLQEDIPTFLLVDIQMPDMSGYELLELIRANKEWSHIPVIAVTAYAMEEDMRRIDESGFDGYIAKPVNVVTILDEISEILESSGSHDDPQ